MKRVILTPLSPPPSALAELKQWLGITLGSDDALLSALLKTALDTCEAFTGTLPLETEIEEHFQANCQSANTWHTLSTRPIQAIVGLDWGHADGSRTALAPHQWEADLTADGQGRIRIAPALHGTHLIAFCTAGLAPDWEQLPEPLRHGIMRLAAHQHRERESSGAQSIPPASVAALWRPWRRMRLI